MRSREELIGSMVEELSDAESDALGNMGLNSCDRCGMIEVSDDLVWVEYIDIEEQPRLREALKEYTAVCQDCADRVEEEL